MGRGKKQKVMKEVFPRSGYSPSGTRTERSGTALQ